MIFIRDTINLKDKRCLADIFPKYYEFGELQN